MQGATLETHAVTEKLPGNKRLIPIPDHIEAKKTGEAGMVVKPFSSLGEEKGWDEVGFGFIKPRPTSPPPSPPYGRRGSPTARQSHFRPLTSLVHYDRGLVSLTIIVG
jgi:hypothetical protein